MTGYAKTCRVKCFSVKILWGRDEEHMGWVGGWVGNMSLLVERGEGGGKLTSN